MVRTKGLEPIHLAIPDPKSGASASSATSAVNPNLAVEILAKKIFKSRKIIKLLYCCPKFYKMPGNNVHDNKKQDKACQKIS